MIDRVTRDPAIPHQLTHFLRAFLALEWLGGREGNGMGAHHL